MNSKVLEVAQQASVAHDLFNFKDPYFDSNSSSESSDTESSETFSDSYDDVDKDKFSLPDSFDRYNTSITKGWFQKINNSFL
jgi:hypothetical protein